MPAPKSMLVLAGTLGLAACAPVVPTGPAVLVLPPAGKDLARFQQEDSACRQYASAQIGQGSPGQAASQGAAGARYASSPYAGLQRRYDIAYIQCMAASGNRLPSSPDVGT